MAESKFPDSTVITDCPIDDCSGQIEVELRVSPHQPALANSLAVDVRPIGFKLQGDHNHPDPWFEITD